jgi:hypothetical protein
MTDTTALTIPRTASTAIATETRTFGLHSQETGGFLMTPTGATTVTVVAVAGTTGIIRHRNLLQISTRALARLFDYADNQDLRIPAQFHSHETLAFLSRTDTEHGLRVEGFTSVVIPTFANPPDDPTDWGWWTFHHPTWSPTSPGLHGTGDIQLIRFDEDGIHAY